MRITLELASRDSESELSELVERNRQFHEPWVYHGTTAQYFERVDQGKTIGLFARVNHGGQLFAVVNLNNPIEGNFRNAFLGYFQDSAFAGRGLMTEALAIFLEYAFYKLLLHRSRRTFNRVMTVPSPL